MNIYIYIYIYMYIYTHKIINKTTTYTSTIRLKVIVAWGILLWYSTKITLHILCKDIKNISKQIKDETLTSFFTHSHSLPGNRHSTNNSWSFSQSERSFIFESPLLTITYPVPRVRLISICAKVDFMSWFSCKEILFIKHPFKLVLS